MPSPAAGLLGCCFLFGWALGVPGPSALCLLSSKVKPGSVPFWVPPGAEQRWLSPTLEILNLSGATAVSAMKLLGQEPDPGSSPKSYGGQQAL